MVNNINSNIPGVNENIQPRQTETQGKRGLATKSDRKPEAERKPLGELAVSSVQSKPNQGKKIKPAPVAGSAPVFLPQFQQKKIVKGVKANVTAKVEAKPKPAPVAPVVAKSKPDVAPATPASPVVVKPVEPVVTVETAPRAPAKPTTKLEKYKAKMANRKARTAATKAEEAVAAKAKLLETQRGFKLNPLELDLINKGKSWTFIRDTTDLATDFSSDKLVPYSVGEQHAWKRLNFFLVMGNYISNKATHLKDFELPIREQNQYMASAYVFPASSTPQEGFERAHISILNKIVVKQDTNLFKLSGELTVQGKIKTSLHQFFNLCDVTPRLVNVIDGYAEFFLRDESISLLNKVKSGELTAMEAAAKFSRAYGLCMDELQERIEKNDIRPPEGSKTRKDQFKGLMNDIMQNSKTALEYIDGMGSAAMDFRIKSSPKLRELISSVMPVPASNLYV